MVEYIVAIDVTRVRFPADAFHHVFAHARARAMHLYGTSRAKHRKQLSTRGRLIASGAGDAASAIASVLCATRLVETYAGMTECS